jgi:hypothetical protein
MYLVWLDRKCFSAPAFDTAGLGLALAVAAMSVSADSALTAMIFVCARSTSNQFEYNILLSKHPVIVNPLRGITL